MGRASQKSIDAEKRRQILTEAVQTSSREDHTKRIRKWQSGSIALDFDGESTNYRTTATMPNHTRHTRGENIKRIRERKKVDNLVVDMVNNKITGREEAVAREEKKDDKLWRSNIVFGMEKDDVDEKYGDYIPKNRSVARESTMVKGANDNDLLAWKEEAKEKRRVLQSTSGGMQLGEDKRIFETEACAAAKRMLHKQRAGGDACTQVRYTSGSRGPHHKDSVGELLGGDKRIFETEAGAAAKRMLHKQRAGGDEWTQVRYTSGSRGPHHKDSVGELLGGDPEFE